MTLQLHFDLQKIQEGRLDCSGPYLFLTKQNTSNAQEFIKSLGK